MRTYDDDFKARALNMIKPDNSNIIEVSKQLGCSSSVLYTWLASVGRHERREPNPLNTKIKKLKEKIEALEAENQVLVNKLFKAYDKLMN